jgi:hypothetical protein
MSYETRRRCLLQFGLLAALAATGGCGKEGPPVPPFRAVPAPTRDLAVRQRGPRAILSFTYPQTTPAGKPLEGVSAVAVSEAQRPLGAGAPTPEPLDPRQYAGLAKQRLKLAAQEVTAATTGNRIDVELDLPQPLPAPPVAHYYAVKTFGPKGDASDFSNQAVLVPKTPPPPPEDVTVTPRADGILVEWVPPLPPPPAPAAPPAPAPTAPGAAAPGAKPGTTGAQAGTAGTAGAKPGAAGTAGAKPGGAPPAAAPAAPSPPAGPGGFNVYRRGAQQRASFQPIATVKPGERSYLDSGAAFGQSYIYTVTTVDAADPKVESAVRTEREIKYVDRFPPPVPTELVAIAETPTRVRLVWKPVEAADLAGYLVYRQGPAGGDFVRLTERPVTAPGYVDPTVAAGQSYTYRVTAIDQAGNESAPGAPVRVTTPAP